MLIKWKGVDGNTVKVISRDVPKGVSLASDSPISAQQLASSSTYGTTTGTATATTTTYTYVTTTEIVVVVVTVFYDANGRILDVKTTEHRTKLTQQER